MVKTYVIVGGVAGGAGAAARLRRLDEEARIVLVERGAYLSYANCGLPYYAGNVINDRSKLFVTSEETFIDVLRIEVRTLTQATAISPDRHEVVLKDLRSGTEETLQYDALVLSPGASPFIPPIEGKDDKAVYTVRNVPDIDKVVSAIQSGARRATVVGGGFIGIEMAENLVERGLDVNMVEGAPQCMLSLDEDMAAQVHQALLNNGVKLHLNSKVEAIIRHGDTVEVKTSAGSIMDNDMVIMSIGVVPESGLAKDAGIKLGPKGHIIVNERFETSAKDVYAIGDAIQFRSQLTDTEQAIALAGPANKMARLVADAIVTGTCKPYPGTLGASAVKVFSISAGSVGLGSKQLDALKIPYETAITHATSNATYYPAAPSLSAKIHYSPSTGKLLGGQLVGGAGVDKHIDVISAIIAHEGTVQDLAEFEQAYAPPFNSAKDILNNLGFIAANNMEGLTRTITADKAQTLMDNGAFLLDVRTQDEFELGSINGAVNIPQSTLRAHLNELPADRPILVICTIGKRAHIACRILSQRGFKDVFNITGGYRTWSILLKDRSLRAEDSFHAKAEPPAQPPAQLAAQPAAQLPTQPDMNAIPQPVNGIASQPSDGTNPHPAKGAVQEKAPCGYSQTAAPTLTLDACGLQCPGPIIQLKHKIDSLQNGQSLLVKASDPGFYSDVKSWCSLTGNRLDDLKQDPDGIITALITKATSGQPAPSSPCPPQSSALQPASGVKGATIIVFSNDFDRTLASFVLANGAAASGKDVVMFFTFWGLSVLRKHPNKRVKKDFMGKMFGAMLPSDMDHLKLLSMNFGGMGPKMMKSRMKKKNVSQLRQMFSEAKANNVRFIACQMSMDIMGITASELLDGVEIGGVGTYMAEASKSDVNLFI